MTHLTEDLMTWELNEEQTKPLRRSPIIDILLYILHTCNKHVCFCSIYHILQNTCAYNNFFKQIQVCTVPKKYSTFKLLLQYVREMLAHIQMLNTIDGFIIHPYTSAIMQIVREIVGTTVQMLSNFL